MADDAHHYYMQIQPDWQDLARDEESDEVRCWLDVYERSVRLTRQSEDSSSKNDNREKEKLQQVQIESTASAHFELELNAARDQCIAPRGRDASASHPQHHLVEITKREKQWVEVHAHIGGNQQHTVRTVFQSPTATMHATSSTDGSAANRQLHAVDVSSDEKFIAVGGADGLCTLWDALDRTESVVLSGHLLDVTRVRFFPSSKVLLTGSLDFTVRIWSAESGKCAAILKGHRGGVEDLAILGKGRNVLSSSSDGLIHLWSCGTQDVIARWGNDAQSAVHCLAVLDDAATKSLVEEGPQTAPHDLEAETDGRVLFAGLENGGILGVDIRAREAVLNLRGTASILSCAATSKDSVPLLLTGSEDGILTTWDLRNTSSPLHSLSRSSAPVNRIALGSNASVWTAHGDGSCCNWSHLVSSNDTTAAAGHAGVSTELTGPLYDPVRDVAIAPRTGRVVTVCRDGQLRDYIPHLH